MLPEFLNVFKPGTVSHLESEIWGRERAEGPTVGGDTHTVSGVDANSRLSLVKRLQNSWKVPR